MRYEQLPAGAEPFSASLFVPEADHKIDFYVTGVIPDSAMLTLADESGSGLSTDKVIMTKPVAEQLKLKQGDTVNIVRKLDGRKFSLQIEGIADTYAGKFIYMPLTDYNVKFGMPEGSYTGAFSHVRLDVPVDESYTVISIDEKTDAVRETMAPVQSMVGFLSAIAFIIGMIVIYVVTSLIVEENKSIISLLKIFGYRKKETHSLILNSSTIVVVLGYLIGIPLTLAAIGALIESLKNSMGVVLPPLKISPLYTLIGFIVVMFSYELSKRLCKKKSQCRFYERGLKIRNGIAFLPLANLNQTLKTSALTRKCWRYPAISR
ncbi:ABC transporter permease [Paenibacillus sp. DMB20]|uniref:ABC transporter permease n=1 Tax=Paenibacillus sp. DMB20 TaxID=1642570 RepID=UPI0013649DB6|nr:ABC transporter permease [Paenibacillus sp. DMB20]